jgi:S-(hydroxymethyl)glutathione dehydrogenase/alcohol dehydrogenase
MGCSTFSEYTVVAEVSLAKINPEATPNMSACSAAASPPASAQSTIPPRSSPETRSPCSASARHRPRGDSGCAPGEGGSHHRHRHQSVQVRAGTQFGATDCINPKDHDKPIQQVLIEMTGWGIDHTFECIGNVQRHARRA